MKLAKAYDPKLYEDDIYALWEKSDAFAPHGTGKPYSIVVPPPNANGNLHLGHALTLGVEDIAIRYHRLLGDRTLFVPGADHAGFETQVVYEKKLAAEGKSRFDFSREELYAQIWDFVAENKTNYESQFRRLGASVDWAQYTYTLDDKITAQAHATFKKMWDEGLIYRGERLVNFCTFHGTGFADIEVEFKEEQGSLWHIRYPLTDGSGEVVVATTRPETLFGDVAVAVHPDDERYKNFVGKTVKLPLTERELPIITDDFVDREFGTGAVKITPAHDPNDYEVGERHDLPKVTVIGHDGTLIDVPEAYRGLSVTDGRKKVVDDLTKQKAIVKTDSHKHSVGHCYKCGTVIQPLLRKQWFISVKSLTKPAIKALEKGEITFYPDSKRTVLIEYYKKLRDWNISRQIAWGIPIPAFQNVDDEEDWIFDTRVTEEFITVADKSYRRDPDVFDTWFSSASWPYATIDYPDGDRFKEFYPLSLMETGFDILQPWVSRMIMFGLYVTGKVPFKAVYLHGLVLDEKGQKMSKSKGNVVNPMEKIDEYSSDALRIGVITGQSAGQNQPFGEPKLVSARNFCNKLWNVARFIEGLTGEDFVLGTPEATSPADHWILSKLQQTIETMTSLLDEYRFSEAYETLYHFTWDDLADWYIEASKNEPNKQLLAYILESTLTLAHPFAPFLTETIWQALGWRETLLISHDWPTALKSDKSRVTEFEEIRTIVTEARYITKALKTSHTTLYHTGVGFLEDHSGLIARLARLDAVMAVQDGAGLHLTQTKHRCWLDISQSTAQAYVAELAEKIESQGKIISQLESRLKNKSYVANAPKKIVDQTKAQLKDAEELQASITKEHDRFKI